jgi:hypothetical protein
VQIFLADVNDVLVDPLPGRAQLRGVEDGRCSLAGLVDEDLHMIAATNLYQLRQKARLFLEKFKNYL